MNRIPDDEVEWIDTGILLLHEGPSGGLHRWRFELPRPLADWDVFAQWERARFESMGEYLRPGMTLFDVGTEQGWCNLAYAAMVGPENMVLIEPSSYFWPNIKQTWLRNYYARPKACYQGLFSNVTDDDRDLGSPWAANWPECADGWIIDRNKYQYIHENDDVPQIRLDDFVKRSGVVPDAVTMDVEGAELLVLQGAEQTLKTRHPLLWISIHPDLGARDYGITAEQTLDFLHSLGYESEHIADDHEQHYRFW